MAWRARCGHSRRAPRRLALSGVGALLGRVVVDAAQQLGRLGARGARLDQRSGEPPRRDLLLPAHACRAHTPRTASLHRRAWSSTPSARPDSAAKSAARAGCTVSSGPEGSKAMPGRVARAFTSRVRASRWRCTAGLVAVVGCLLDQVGGGPSPKHHQHRRARAGPTALERQHTLDELERRCRIVLAPAASRPSGSRHALWPLLEVGHDLVGAGQVIARGVVRASACGQHARADPDHRLGVGGAGGRQTGAHDASRPRRGLPCASRTSARNTARHAASCPDGATTRTGRAAARGRGAGLRWHNEIISLSVERVAHDAGTRPRPRRAASWPIASRSACRRSVSIARHGAGSLSAC